MTMGPEKNPSRPRIVYISRFQPSIRGGGGSRRILQIMKLIRKHPFRLLTTWRRDGISREQSRAIKKKWELFNKNTIGRDEYSLWPHSRLKYAYQLRELGKIWSSSLQHFQNLKLLLVDDPLFFPSLIQSDAAGNLPVAAVCHNLESIALKTNSNKSPWLLLEKEIRLLRKCDLVITISREEQALLINLGVNAFFLPYFPVEPIRKRMLEVRKKRKTTHKRALLLLGNIGNIPTREGMQKVIAWWKQRPLLAHRDKLIIAGFETSRNFFDISPGAGIEMRGDISDQELDHLLSHVKAALCYQETGGGALTKISEFLTAGVPVLSNFHAARSYHHLPGILEFGDWSQLTHMINKLEEYNNPCPIPQKPDTHWIEQYIKETISR
jgi:hypothetical protein